MNTWLFLDVDGVLNNESTKDLTPEGFRGLDEDKIVLLAGFVHEIGARVVLTSTWKDTDLWFREKNPGADLAYLLNRLAEHDVEIAAYARDGDRGAAVLAFLEKQLQSSRCGAISGADIPARGVAGQAYQAGKTLA